MDVRGAVSLIRPINCMMIGFAVVVGLYVTNPDFGIATPVPIALGFLTGFFICAYSMAINDIYDVEVDSVNRPERPIPSGKVSPQQAFRISEIVLMAGVACSFLSLNATAIVIALVYAFLSWLYNTKAKKTGFGGNLIVASSLAIPFIYGGVISGGSITRSLLIMMALTSFFAGVGREVVKAMADVDGDAKRGVESIARRNGPKAASRVGAAFFLLAVVTSWVPILTGLANALYMYGVLLPDAIFIYLAVAIISTPDPVNAYRVKKVALAGMTAGLVVFIGGAF